MNTSELNEKQARKYTAKSWILTSPEGRYQGVITINKAVSLEYMRQHFKGGWIIKPLFPSEREVAEGKVMRAQGRK